MARLRMRTRVGLTRGSAILMVGILLCAIPGPRSATATTLSGSDSPSASASCGRAWSDPLSYALPPDTDVAIGVFAQEDTGPLTGHTTSPALADRPPSLQATGEVRTSYLSPSGSGDHTHDPSADGFTLSTSTEMLVDAVDVLLDAPTGAVVVLGDSISDGTNSTQDADRSWPDHLARRLLAEHPARRMSVLNMGIAGNAVTGDGSGRKPSTRPCRRRSAAERLMGETCARFPTARS